MSTYYSTLPKGWRKRYLLFTTLCGISWAVLFWLVHYFPMVMESSWRFICFSIPTVLTLTLLPYYRELHRLEAHPESIRLCENGVTYQKMKKTLFWPCHEIQAIVPFRHNQWHYGLEVRTKYDTHRIRWFSEWTVNELRKLKGYTDDT